MTMSPEQSYSRERCIEEGGHFWPLGAPDDQPQTCKRCGYNPGWIAGPVENQKAEQSNIDAARLMGRLSEVGDLLLSLRSEVWSSIVDKRPVPLSSARQVVRKQEAAHRLLTELMTDLRGAMRLADDDRVGNRS